MTMLKKKCVAHARSKNWGTAKHCKHLARGYGLCVSHLQQRTRAGGVESGLRPLLGLHGRKRKASVMVITRVSAAAARTIGRLGVKAGARPGRGTYRGIQTLVEAFRTGALAWADSNGERPPLDQPERQDGSSHVVRGEVERVAALKVSRLGVMRGAARGRATYRGLQFLVESFHAGEVRWAPGKEPGAAKLTD